MLRGFRTSVWKQGHYGVLPNNYQGLEGRVDLWRRNDLLLVHLLLVHLLLVLLVLLLVHLLLLLLHLHLLLLLLLLLHEGHLLHLRHLLQLAHLVQEALRKVAHLKAPMCGGVGA